MHLNVSLRNASNDGISPLAPSRESQKVPQVVLGALTSTPTQRNEIQKVLKFSKVLLVRCQIWKSHVSTQPCTNEIVARWLPAYLIPHRLRTPCLNLP
jgi:hypothetical protein